MQTNPFISTLSTVSCHMELVIRICMHNDYYLMYAFLLIRRRNICKRPDSCFIISPTCFNMHYYDYIKMALGTCMRICMFFIRKFTEIRMKNWIGSSFCSSLCCVCISIAWVFSPVLYLFKYCLTMYKVIVCFLIFCKKW